ncbi:MAG: hypothetical protein A2528_01160 [Candidatus Staskawiczbacteria bacterium RIFOXYD2_FULL_37_9]|nr:MAG: hypothetical protein A2416_04465 [Candidatus Staskawiczbacteria bacterium RIFOXYC1_FULL_37_52]OGZ89562.1 MAG: hypothetical protein A2581_03845 [Candidatus Staskawiczbacteria bacterium RIFOXYD1_FULL_37_110]OGZ92920.1 MAG: hypothetical protein A2528_01160 [Candidatus Staskawiczbacteria bacterium RIFOXYD2_FULL_37_9]
MRGYFRKTPISENKELQSYVIGLALGDGNLSNPNKRAVRLRITCDAKYPSLVQKIKNSLQLLFPKNKASVSNRKNNYYNVSVYSNRLKEIIPWKTGNGPKFEQMASIPDWIKTNNNYKINCLRGLIETDGCIYKDRGYKMMAFTTIIPKLANDFHEMVVSLGFKPHSYKINHKPSAKYKFNQQTTYHIRLSKNVDKFLELIKPEKN